MTPTIASQSLQSYMDANPDNRLAKAIHEGLGAFGIPAAKIQQEQD